MGEFERRIQIKLIYIWELFEIKELHGNFKLFFIDVLINIRKLSEEEEEDEEGEGEIKRKRWKWKWNKSKKEFQKTTKRGSCSWNVFIFYKENPESSSGWCSSSRCPNPIK